MKQSTVQINDEYRILIDPSNYQLQKFEPSKEITSGAKKGQMSERKWLTAGYYPNMGQCLRALVETQIILFDSHSLEHYIDRYEELTNKLLKVINSED